MSAPRRTRWIGPPAVLALAVAAGGAGDCRGPFAVDCSLIGCSDGLTVVVISASEEPVTVRVTADGEQRSVICQDTNPCFAFFDDWTPEQVEIEVEGPAGVTTATATPAYERVRPNGPRCPPECRQAAVEVEVD